MYQPTLQTERLTLRPRTLEDFEDCLEMDRDPAVTRYVPGPWEDPVEHRAFLIDRLTRSVANHQLGYWTVCPRESNTFLGWVFLLPATSPTLASQAEIGWRFVQEAWGCGVATEAAGAVLCHAETLGLQRVHAEILEGNVGSIRVASKLGMRLGERLINRHGLIDVYVASWS